MLDPGLTVSAHIKRQAKNILRVAKRLDFHGIVDDLHLFYKLLVNGSPLVVLHVVNV